MCLDKLPDDVLLHFFFYFNAKDIGSLQRTNSRLSNHIKEYRLHYSKTNVFGLDILMKEDGQREIEIQLSDLKSKIMVPELNNNLVKSMNPFWLSTCDLDDVLKMNPLWWKDIRHIILDVITDYRGFLPHFDRCDIVQLESKLPKNLTEIMKFMETKNLETLMVEGDGELECTDDDLRKIGKLSAEMGVLVLSNVSESCKPSNDGLLDMIEMGSFINFIQIFISRIENFENIDECLKQRKWVQRYDKPHVNNLKIETTNGRTIFVYFLPILLLPILL